MFASRRNAIDDQVHERFIRVVGRPENADPPPARVVALPEPSAPVVALPDPDNDAGPVSRAGPGSGVGPTSGVGPGSGGPGDAVGPAPAGAAAARPAPVAERALPGLRGALLTLDPGHRGVRALALVAVVAVAAAAFFAWRSRPEVEPVAAVRAEAASADASSPSPAGTVVVAVTGKVVHPGLVRLPSGSRVADAIEAAGGVQPGTDLSFVNLARKVVDGELIAVGITAPPGTALDGATGTAGGAGAAADGPLNLNLATEAQFESLPGIGPVLAQHIVDYRTAHGQFRSVDELKQVSGLGASRFAQIKALVTV